MQSPNAAAARDRALRAARLVSGSVVAASVAATGGLTAVVAASHTTEDGTDGLSRLLGGDQVAAAGSAAAEVALADPDAEVGEPSDGGAATLSGTSAAAASAASAQSAPVAPMGADGSPSTAPGAAVPDAPASPEEPAPLQPAPAPVVAEPAPAPADPQPAPAPAPAP
ncbi:MAG: hypothetical protein ACFCVF_07290, partial [Kineosporiaceae bacterium]